VRTWPWTSILLLAVALLAGGCGTFNHEWKQAGKNPARPDEFEGRWQGTWLSDVSGHTDQLRCLISQTGDGTYRARFHAKYRKVLSFGYTVPLKVEPRGGGYAFQGKANLGWMAGGVYQYEGFADSTNFHSSYECKYDHGTFQMGRPFQ
jgi:hypothetical protein